MNHVQGDPPAMPDRERWSVRLGPAAATVDHAGRELVVLAPPGTAVARGFARLHEELRHASGAVLRLVAHGATLANHRPEWLAAPPPTGVILTELDAYQPCNRSPLLREPEQALARWLRDTLAGALPDEAAPVDEVFWASAMRRVFAPYFASWPLARGLATHHGHDTIVCLDASWAGAFALQKLLAESGGLVRLEQAPRTRQRLWGLRVGAHVGINLAAAAAVRSREFLRERRSRARLRALRAELGDGASPDVWIGLLGEWPRSCRHVIEGVAAAARERGQTIGVLLHESLLPGSAQADVAGASPVFPALDHPLLRETMVALEQCTAAEHPADLARNLAGTAVAAARIATRIGRSDPRASLGPVPLALDTNVTGLARLATFELMRAREAHVASRALLARRDFRGKRIVWPHASVANDVVPDLLLQRAGAATFDLVHGALAETLDFITHARTYSSTAVWWTEAEVRYIGPYLPHQRAVGGYVPRAIADRDTTRAAQDGREAAARPLRVLVVSNYATPTLGLGGAFTRECYQDPLLDAVATATRGCEVPLEIRWRPHPYDDKPRIEASLRRWPGAAPLAMSTAPDGLQAELAWSDVVVSSISSSIVEALLHPVALFVHDVPLHERDVLMCFFDPSRRFAGGEDLAPQFRRFVAGHRAGDPRRFEPEQALRGSFFGPTRRPRDLGELLWP